MNSISGYLRKFKRCVFLVGNTNKRWFELDFEKQIFGYKNVKESINYLEKINFHDIKDYSSFLNKNLKICDYKYGFKINTIKRIFYLYAKTEEEKNMWENGFNQMMKIIRELPSFDNEKENRLYTEGNDDLHYINVVNNRKQSESNIDLKKTNNESINSDNENINNNVEYSNNNIQHRNSITTYKVEFNGKNQRKKKRISFYY